MNAWTRLRTLFEQRTVREQWAIAALAVLGLPLAIAAAWAEPTWRINRSLTLQADAARAESTRAGAGLGNRALVADGTAVTTATGVYTLATLAGS